MDEPRILFGFPNTLENRKNERLTGDDLTILAKSLENCTMIDWNLFGRHHFNLGKADTQNIDKDNQEHALKILKMVDKWNEQSGIEATPAKVNEILDQAHLCGVKHLWWCEYQDGQTKKKIEDFKKERKRLMQKFVKLPVTKENCTKLFLELEMDDKENAVVEPSNTTKKLQSLFDWWTERYGFVKASNEHLIKALKDCGMKKEACVLSGEEYDADVASNVNVPTTSNRLGRDSGGLEGFQFDFGILSIKEDDEIATRLKLFLEKREFTARKFEEYISPDGAGVPKAGKITSFCNNCICILWVATSASIQCKSYDEFNVENALHNAIHQEKKHFVVFIPKEHLKPQLKMPAPLGAYEPLLENQDFPTCLEATYERIKKKLRSLGR